jgi:leucyl aminopeptidase
LPSDVYETSLMIGESDQPILFVISAGPRSELEPLLLTRLAAAGLRFATGKKYRRLAIVDPNFHGHVSFGGWATEGEIRGACINGVRKFDRERDRKLDSLVLISSEDSNFLVRHAQLGQIIGEPSTLARDPVNLPPNDLTPAALAERASQIPGLQTEVLGQEDMEKLGMGCGETERLGTRGRGGCDRWTGAVLANANLSRILASHG